MEPTFLHQFSIHQVKITRSQHKPWVWLQWKIDQDFVSIACVWFEAIAKKVWLNDKKVTWFGL